MFATLKKRNWLVAAEKLRLGYTQIAVLGWLVGNGKKQADPKKLDGVRNLKPPTNADEVRSFLGVVGWYRDLNSKFG